MKKLITFLIILLIMSGCATLNKPAPKSNPNLPVVKTFKAYPDRNAIALFWSVVPQMSGYYIQRFNAKNNKWEQIATIKDPYKSIYVDTGLKPAHIYKYKIATFDKNGIPSLAKEVDQATLPKLQPVVPLEAKPLTKGEVKVIFRPHPNERVYKYIIQRYNDKTTKWEDLATVKPRLNVEYIDKGLKDGKIYKYRIIAVTFDKLYSLPSNPIVVSTYPKPPVILKINASTDLPKKIKVTFSPVPNAVYYKIYISDIPDNGSFSFYKKTNSTVFIDHINQDGVTRYYKVTAVSKHGTESILSDTPVAMGQTLPKPASPLVSTNRMGNTMEFIFTSPDNRAVKYLIIRKESKSLFKSNTKKLIANSNRFTDTINPKYSYKYQIYEIDRYGLISKKPAVIEVN